MKILYQGTAAAEGIPALFCECEACRHARAVGGHEIRMRSGALVDGVLKLDFGPDSYRQELDAHLDYSHLKSVLITHSHEDHLSAHELALRREVYAYVYGEDNVMTVYGNARTGDLLAKYLNPLLEYRQVFPFETFETAEGYRVTPLDAVHCVWDQGGMYPLTYKGKKYFRSEQALFYLIEKDDKRLLYGHDTSEFTSEDMEFLAGKHLDLVSLDCTNGALVNKWVGHMGCENDLNMRRALTENGAADGRTVFVANHFSHNGVRPEAEMQQLLPGFIIAYDGLEIEF
ncbi:MAG: hypothetical protein IKR85_08155 [Clostridia bacterium]|nr:hypothetical protein [Clostridia bacterium]